MSQSELLVSRRTLFGIAGATTAAVTLAADALQPPYDRPHGAIESIVDGITPAVGEALTQQGDLLKNAILSNIAHSRDVIKGDPEPEDYLKFDAVKIATGYYNLSDGTAPLS